MKKKYITPRTLHITDGDRKFIPELIEFFKEFFDYSKHDFIVLSRFPERKIEDLKYFCTKNKNTPSELDKIIPNYNKIVIHGLLDFYLVRCLLKVNLDFSRTYWLLWGGDVYCYRNEKGRLRRMYRNFVRKTLISKLQHAGSLIKGGVDLSRDWYGFRGSYHECMGYVSNTINLNTKLHKRIAFFKKHTVIIGNSGYESNFHKEIFNLLKKQSNEIKVICPLAYGNQNYIDEIISLGTKLFKKNFTPLLNYLPLNEYYSTLSGVDSGIFAHDREQGTGNVIPLLGMGKKVYLRTTTTQWNTYLNLGLKIFDYKDFGLHEISKSDQQQNIEIVSKYFCKENLAKQYELMLT